MNCVLIFDHLNDVLFSKYNKSFAVHINRYARNNGLTREVFQNEAVSNNLLVQIFSPIVTSQRIMSCQFGNAYTSIQCLDELNLAFEEYMGYLFISISKDDVEYMRKYLCICATIIRYLCGPDLTQLKKNPDLPGTVSKIIDSWIDLSSNEQSVYVEAVEQLVVNSELSSVSVDAAKKVVNAMQSFTSCNKIHALLLVQNKFLSLYSSEHASELSAQDTLFIILLNAARFPRIVIEKKASSSTSETDSDDQMHSSKCHDNLLDKKHHSTGTTSYQVLLSGSTHRDYHTLSLPHTIHFASLTPSLTLCVALETGDKHIALALHTAFIQLHRIQQVQLQREVKALRPVFGELDAAVRRLCDLLRRVKDTYVEGCYRTLQRQWEFMRKRYGEYIKTGANDAILRAESCTGGILESLQQILAVTSFDRVMLEGSAKHMPKLTATVVKQLSPYDNFLNVKALQNFTLGSDSLTINKYLEEFPGLVHFLFIDRTQHRITTPTLHFDEPDSNNLTKNKIWSMVRLATDHLSQGHMSMLWKDTRFNYAYFLWFEDSTGSALKPHVFPSQATKPLPEPGILLGDFYQRLKEVCFPKMSSSKVRCYELYCIHLGLVTSSCVLEHTRRLAATIWDLQGHPNHPMDIF